MGKDIETTSKFKLDISELKSGIQEANRTIRLANSEFKASTAGMKGWENAADGLSPKLKQLEKVVGAENAKLGILEEQYRRVAKEQGENSKGAQELLIKINNQKAAVAGAEAKLGEYETKLEDVKKASSDAADGTEKYSSASEKLKTEINGQETELAQLKKSYADVVLEQGKGGEEAQKLGKEIEDLSTELKDNKAQMQDAKDEANKMDKSLEEVENSTGKAEKGFSTMNAVLAGVIVSGIKMAVDAFQNLGREAIKAFDEVDEGSDNVIKATGATGDKAKELEGIYRKVASSIKGDFADIGNTVGEINTRFGFMGTELEECSEKFTKFADITGTDAKTAVQLVSRAMGDAGIPASEYNSVLDDLAAAAQASGIGVDKLTEYITKYGAPMRNLGYDTKESIAIFAQWEKSGVNIEIAFSGMKKAISNFTADGKDAKVEFKNLVEGVENGSVSAQEALEIFGAKAGPDLVDAIQQGRFSYEDFMTVLESSEGTVEKTFAGTEDGIDKVKISIQKAKIEMGDFTGSIIDKYQPQITKAIDGTIKKAKEIVTYVIDNGAEIKTVLKGIGTIMGTILVVNKTSAFIKSIMGITTAVTAWKAKTGAQTVAQAALNTVMMANPIGVVVAGIMGMVGAIAISNKQSEDRIGKIAGLTTKEKELSDRLNEQAESYKMLEESRIQAVQDIETESGHTQNLANELKGLADENGNITEENRERASVIANELSQALGTEITITDGVIDNYGELKQSIDQVILSQKAEAIQSALKSEYAEAIKNQTDAYMEYQTAQDNVTETTTRLKDAQAELDGINKKYNDGVGLSEAGYAEYTNALKGAGEEVEGLKGKLESQSGILESTESKYVKYNTTIANYEGVTAAIASKDAAQIEAALLNATSGFVTAETGTKASLENQVKNMSKNYDGLKEAVASGAPGVTQAMVDKAKIMVDKSTVEMDKFQEKAKASTEAAGKKAGEGLDLSVPGNLEIAKKLGMVVVQGIAYDPEAVLNAGNEKGAKAGEGLEAGIASKEGAINLTAKGVADSANAYLGSANTLATGTRKGGDFNAGLGGQSGNAKTQGKNLSDNANSGAGGGNLSQTGQAAGQQYASGVGGQSENAKKKGKELGTSAKDGAGGVKTSQIGIDFADGFAKGIEKGTNPAINAAVSLASAAWKALKKELDSNSPSKVTDAVGGDFTVGFANGIARKAKEAVKEAKSMVSDVLVPLETIQLDIPGIKARIGQAGTVMGNYQKNTTTNATTNVFNQYNTSPKALSRLEIYRQTRNQINFSKGV